MVKSGAVVVVLALAWSLGALDNGRWCGVVVAMRVAGVVDEGCWCCLKNDNEWKCPFFFFVFFALVSSSILSVKSVFLKL